MTVRQAVVSQERDCMGEKEGIQTEEAGTEQGGTGGDTDGKEVDLIMTYTKPNQPDPKVKNKCSKTGH